MDKIKKHKELINFKWKTKKCGTENCWCRCIVPKGKVFWNDKDKDEAGVCHAGCLPKEIAEHIVDIHNSWLNGNKF